MASLQLQSQSSHLIFSSSSKRPINVATHLPKARTPAITFSILKLPMVTTNLKVFKDQLKNGDRLIRERNNSLRGVDSAVTVKLYAIL